MTSPAPLHAAKQLHAQGKNAQAQEICRQIVASEPDNGEAWHLSGLVLRQQGDLSAAIDSFLRAAKLDGANASLLYDLAEVYWTTGKLHDAELALRRAANLQPDDPKIQTTLGVVLNAQRRYTQAIAPLRRALELKTGASQIYYELALALTGLKQDDEAISHYRRAIEIKPDFAAAHCNLGTLLQARGQLDEAIASYRRSLQADPRSALAANNVGNALREQGQLEEAAAAYEQARSLDRGLAMAHFNLGLVRKEQARWNEARVCFLDTVEIDSQSADAHCHLADTLIHLRRYIEAATHCQNALKIRPGMIAAEVNLGLILQAQGQLADAEAQYRQTIARDPRCADAHNNLGTVLRLLGQFREAMECHERALTIDPQHVGARMNRGLMRLVQGDFERGFQDYEARWELPEAVVPMFSKSAWQGESLSGRTLLVWAEQGFGDTLQFVRYVKLLCQRGEKLVCRVPRQLAPLLKTSGFANIILEGADLPLFDVHAPLASLPRLLGTTLSTIPCQVPYLSADEHLREIWQRQLRRRAGFKIGIAWQGNPLFPSDRFRSFHLHDMAPVAQEGVQLISLQKGAGQEQIVELAGKFRVHELGSFDEQHGTFMDTAAIMKSLDLVVTSDSAVAHLAGALGAPVWVALAIGPDWRWLLQRSDSPWYPSMRLFRQTRVGDWAGVFQNMAQALRAMRS